jgi:hypothetical protein
MKLRVLMVAALTSVSASALSAQRLVNWPVRTTALPEATATGAGALFWNPAGVSVVAGSRAEVMVVNLRTPADIGLTGLAVGAVGVFERTVLALGYEHVGLDAITETENSTEALGEINLGEDHFTLAASREVSRALHAGATARYTRDNLAGTDPVVGFGAGLQLDLNMVLSPRLGAYAVTEADQVGWGVGAELRMPAWLGDDYQIGGAYGLNDLGDGLAGHRITAVLGWKDQIGVTGGIMREGGAAEASWQPTLAASLRIHRYTLGVLRESLSNELGSTYSFRLQVGLGH